MKALAMNEKSRKNKGLLRDVSLTSNYLFSSIPPRIFRDFSFITYVLIKIHEYLN